MIVKCKDVQDVTVSLEHMLPDTLNFWLSKFVCEVAKQNEEHYLPNSLYLLVWIRCCVSSNIFQIKR